VEEEQFSKAAFWLDSPRKRYNVNRLQVSSHLAAVAVFICLPGQEPVTRTVGLAELAEKGLLLAMLPRMAFKNRRQPVGIVQMLTGIRARGPCGWAFVRTFVW